MQIRQKMASISQGFSLPAICSLCNQSHRGRCAICSECQHHFTPLGPACQHCAHPLPAGDFLVCGHCCKKKPSVDNVIAAYRFEEPLRSLLHEFKYHEGLYLSSFLATLIVASLPLGAEKTQCLIPVPMHDRRLCQRGFNQAAELAKQLAKALKLPYHLSSCRKVLNTAPQASLNAKERQINLRNAFQTSPLPYHHITLIDDLITTGSTVNELAKAFKKQGVSRVDVWCCAKAVTSFESSKSHQPKHSTS